MKKLKKEKNSNKKKYQSWKKYPHWKYENQNNVKKTCLEKNIKDEKTKKHEKNEKIKEKTLLDCEKKSKEPNNTISPLPSLNFGKFLHF